AGVGFSYQAKVPRDFNYTSSDDEIAELNLQALRSFYRKFPRLLQNTFYLAGESYAGIYVPLLAEQLLDHKFPVNFKGILLGNPLLHHGLLLSSRLKFSLQNRLINLTTHRRVMQACCPVNHTSYR